MRKMVLTASAMMFSSMILVGGQFAAAQYTSEPQATAPPPATRTAPVAIEEEGVAALKQTENIIGRSVQNLEGEKLGEIKSLMVDLNTGQVGYAVLASGGVLGMGRQDYLVPWNALVVEPDKDYLVLNVSPEQLQRAPKGERVTTYEEGRQIHMYYGCPVYWEEPLRQTQPTLVPREPSRIEQPEPSLREPSVR